MDINGVSNTFLNTLTDMKTVEAQTEQSEFESMLKNAMDNKDDESLKEACAEYEAYFLNKVFSEMRQSIPKSDLIEESEGRSIYEDMLYEEYSKEISIGKGAGIRDMLYNQLKKQ